MDEAICKKKCYLIKIHESLRVLLLYYIFYTSLFSQKTTLCDLARKYDFFFIFLKRMSLFCLYSPYKHQMTAKTYNVTNREIHRLWDQASSTQCSIEEIKKC